MPFPGGSQFHPFARTPTVPAPKQGPVLAVGGRVIVIGRGSDRVSLTDEEGSTAHATIPVGIEVEIVAWRPRRGSTRYRVLSTDVGVEGWLDSASLKARPAPPPTKAVISSRIALPIRGNRAAPRTRSAPALAAGASIKTTATTARALKTTKTRSR